MTPQPEDQIHIEQLEVWARVGVAEAERTKPQRLVINLTLWLFRRIEDLKDEVAKTADYSVVSEKTKEFVETNEYRLIETLADQVAMFLLKRFPIHQARVEVRKFVLANAAYTAAIVTRTAALD